MKVAAYQAALLPHGAMDAIGRVVCTYKNGLPVANADVVSDARNVDIACATENSVTVIRADEAGSMADLVSFGSSEIIDPQGRVLQSARRLSEDILMTDL